MRYLILLLITLSSCSTSVSDVEVVYHDSTEQYSWAVDRFIHEAEIRNVKFNTDTVYIYKEHLSCCNAQAEFPNKVVLSAHSFKLKEDYLTLQLLSHELYHILCQTEYDKEFHRGSIINNRATSIMTILTTAENYPTLDDSVAWNNLFNELWQ